jgi:hypothetical protein
MDTPLKVVLQEIGKEYDLDADVINPVIKKLNSEFYFKLKDVKNASESVWKSLGLPLNLFFLLKDKYDSVLSSNQPQTQSTQQINQHTITMTTSSNAKPIHSPQQQQHQHYSKDEDENHLMMILTEINNIDISREVFKIIYNVIQNIVKNPNDEKYRKINIVKLLSKYNYISIKNLFQYLHFQQVEEFMYIIGTTTQLNDFFMKLTTFITSNQIAKAEFNPYEASYSSLNNDKSKIKAISNTETNFEDLYKEELKRRKQIVNNAKIDHNPRIILSQNTNIFGDSYDMNIIDEKSEDEKLIYKKSMELIQQNANDRFTLKSRTKFEKLINTPIYTKSDIRFRFPDGTLLEGSFALYETIGDIYAFIGSLLKNNKEKFTISTTPPLKKYTKMDESILQLKLFPKVNMYVNYESNSYSGLIEGIKFIN